MFTIEEVLLWQWCFYVHTCRRGCFEQWTLCFALFNGVYLTFFYYFIWQSKSFRAKCFTFSAKTKTEKKKEENYISEMRYLNRLHLKQGSLVIERKETGKSLYDYAMDLLILMSVHGLSLKISPRGYLLLQFLNKLLTNIADSEDSRLYSNTNFRLARIIY